MATPISGVLIKAASSSSGSRCASSAHLGSGPITSSFILILLTNHLTMFPGVHSPALSGARCREAERGGRLQTKLHSVASPRVRGDALLHFHNGPRGRLLFAEPHSGASPFWNRDRFPKPNAYYCSNSEVWGERFDSFCCGSRIATHHSP